MTADMNRLDRRRERSSAHDGIRRSTRPTFRRRRVAQRAQRYESAADDLRRLRRPFVPARRASPPVSSRRAAQAVVWSAASRKERRDAAVPPRARPDDRALRGRVPVAASQDWRLFAIEPQLVEPSPHARPGRDIHPAADTQASTRIELRASARAGRGSDLALVLLPDRYLDTALPSRSSRTPGPPVDASHAAIPADAVGLGSRVVGGSQLWIRQLRFTAADRAVHTHTVRASRFRPSCPATRRTPQVAPAWPDGLVRDTGP